MVSQTHYIIIDATIRHLGDQPTALGGSNFVGDLYYATFNLPDNVDTQQSGVIQCRTKHNQTGNKTFLFNLNVLGNILEPHPNNKDDWFLDIAIVRGSWLEPGQNGIHIGYTTSDFDDFLVDNIILWYKTKESNTTEENGTIRLGPSIPKINKDNI